MGGGGCGRVGVACDVVYRVRWWAAWTGGTPLPLLLPWKRASRTLHPPHTQQSHVPQTCVPDMRAHAPPLQMMIRTGVKVTPFFALYRNGERVHGHGGVNEANLHKAIQANLLTGEAGFGSYTVAPAPKEEEEEDD